MPEHARALTPTADLLRAARYCADLSQRDLAARSGCPRSLISRVEAGRGELQVVTLQRLLDTCGCRVLVLGPAGRPLELPPRNEARDAGGRRYPAHLDVWPLIFLNDWWGWLGALGKPGEPWPALTYYQRPNRDWRRQAKPGDPRFRLAVMEHELGETLRARGMRLTPQRELILNAVARLEHGTPDEILAEVRKSAGAVNASTIYRGLELLERLGLITHAHLGHTTPSYHLAEQAGHLHLVCRDCGEVIEAEVALADDLVRQLAELHGFEPDLKHFAIYGRCRQCQPAAGA